MHARFASAPDQAVSLMPSVSSSARRITTSRGAPATRSISRPRTSIAIEEWTIVLGWNASGTVPRGASVSRRPSTGPLRASMSCCS
jgi:hypothetical protein